MKKYIHTYNEYIHDMQSLAINRKYADNTKVPETKINFRTLYFAYRIPLQIHKRRLKNYAFKY